MLLSQLINELQSLKDEWGDLKVQCAPYSLKAEAQKLRTGRKRCWWCKGLKPDIYSVPTPVPGAPNLSIKINRDEVSREPEPSAWGYPGLGSVRHDGNPAREVLI